MYVYTDIDISKIDTNTNISKFCGIYLSTYSDLDRHKKNSRLKLRHAIASGMYIRQLNENKWPECYVAI